MKTEKIWKQFSNKIDLKKAGTDLLYDIAGNAGFAPGGISGLALLLNYLTGFPVGTMTLLFNIPLVLISYKTVGKQLLLKSAKTLVISSLFLDVVFPFTPMYDGNRMMAATYSGIFLGAGMALFCVLWRNVSFSCGRIYRYAESCSVLFQKSSHILSEVPPLTLQSHELIQGIRETDGSI